MRTPTALAIAVFGLLAVLPPLFLLAGEPFLLVIAIRVMIFAIAAVSLDLILGYGAMVSFGHAAFIGIGAYAVAIPASHGVTDLFAQTLIAIVASCLFALATGAISLRTKGVYFIMITLAFGQMAFFVMVSLAAYGGDDGITLPGRSTLFGAPLIANNFAFFYVVLTCLVGLYFLSHALTRSRFGRVIRASRENPIRVQSVGFSPFPYQLTAYAISGAMAGVAGVLLANQAEFVSPAYMSWQRSGELIAMVVVGGTGTLIGPILGAAGFILLEEWLPALSEHWKLGFGVILVLIVLYTRGGLYGFYRRVMGSARA
ncbi:branched-chain amino acid transport system permease protein [Rhodoligotrophos appendicifer]|uniref:branched-chain amino acid ABC transporter permease n=1 Tax=Rhodoligotrophos appendicifer TaxID=987056 RepID=UPI001FE54734|nr:branched-chain amino acid ABC transporter permease [Rhodoligotrophos appendicifer]